MSSEHLHDLFVRLSPSVPLCLSLFFLSPLSLSLSLSVSLSLSLFLKNQEAVSGRGWTLHRMDQLKELIPVQRLSAEAVTQTWFESIADQRDCGRLRSVDQSAMSKLLDQRLKVGILERPLGVVQPEASADEHAVPVQRGTLKAEAERLLCHEVSGLDTLGQPIRTEHPSFGKGGHDALHRARFRRCHQMCGSQLESIGLGHLASQQNHPLNQSLARSMIVDRMLCFEASERHNETFGRTAQRSGQYGRRPRP
jgi:hypothetical protein